MKIRSQKLIVKITLIATLFIALWLFFCSCSLFLQGISSRVAIGGNPYSEDRDDRAMTCLFGACLFCLIDMGAFMWLLLNRNKK